MGHKYPEMKINEALQSPLAKKLLEYGVAGVGLGGGGALGWDLLKGKL